MTERPLYPYPAAFFEVKQLLDQIIPPKAPPSTAEQLLQLNKELKKIGVDFDFCQLAPVIEAYERGALEMETLGPYAMDHDVMRGSIAALTHEEEIGMNVAVALKRVFPKSVVVALCDEFHTGLPESSDVFGKPIPYNSQNKNHPQSKMSPEAKIHFVREVERHFRERGVIQETDRENENFILLSESERQRDVPGLLAQLQLQSDVCSVETKGEEILLHVKNPENADCSSIQLRTAAGKWTCEALDAAGFAKNPHNKEKCHLLVLPENMRKQQDRVWHILKCLGYVPDQYHNIFYNEAVCENEQLIASSIWESFQRAQKVYEDGNPISVYMADMNRLTSRQLESGMFDALLNAGRSDFY